MRLTPFRCSQRCRGTLWLQVIMSLARYLCTPLATCQLALSLWHTGFLCHASRVGPHSFCCSTSRKNSGKIHDDKSLWELGLFFQDEQMANSLKTLNISLLFVVAFVRFYVLKQCAHGCLCNLVYSVCVFEQMKYTTNPAIMAKVISTCLREERRILSSACMQEQVCHIVSIRGEVPLLPY